MIGSLGYILAVWGRGTGPRGLEMAVAFTGVDSQVLATILGISRMELDPTGGEFVLNVAEMLVMGAAAGLAIAVGIGFGWGGRDWFAKQLEKWSRKSDGTP